MKIFVFILFLNLFGIGNIKPVTLNYLTKDTSVNLPIICFDEIKQDSTIVIENDTTKVSLVLFNTNQILNKENDSIVERYWERALLINYMINKDTIFKKIVFKDSLQSLFQDSLGNKFLNTSLIFYSNIKEIRKGFIKIMLSLSVPDTDYTHKIIIYIRKRGMYTIEFDSNV